MDVVRPQAIADGINRNIMEFKDTKEQVEANLMLRINRNIMEFKDFLIISAFLVAFTN